VTPQMLLAAANKDTLQQALARLGSVNAAESASLAADPGFRGARSRYPENLTSLSYLDLARMPWEKMMESFRGTNKKAGDKSPAGAAGPEDALKQLSPAVLRRHLHTMGSASWKDADGFFGDLFIE